MQKAILKNDPFHAGKHRDICRKTPGHSMENVQTFGLKRLSIIFQGKKQPDFLLNAFRFRTNSHYQKDSHTMCFTPTRQRYTLN